MSDIEGIERDFLSNIFDTLKGGEFNKKKYLENFV